MDFSNFDASEAVLIHSVTNQEVDEDDPQAAPFVDENPCFVCGHKAFANFLDLTFGTSCTSQTAIPVKRKLKEILKKFWDPKKENQILCLACYDLVDRYDSLELQLNNIRENLEDKYQKTTIKKFKNGKPGTTGRKKSRQSAKGRKAKKLKNELDNLCKDDDDEDNYTYEAMVSDTEYQHDEGNDGLDENNIDIKQTDASHYTLPATIEEPIPPPNYNVYDEHHQLLQRGEKIRLGREHKDENGDVSYICGYCPHAWANIASLHTHVHTIHQPEVVDVAIPPEVGLGNTMNCGVEIQNCQEPADTPKPWSCLFCDAAFRARTNMSSHFKDKHTPYKPFSCVDCNEAFRKGIDLNRHKLYFCPQRAVTFAPKRKYKKRDSKEKITPAKKMRPKEDRCE